MNTTSDSGMPDPSDPMAILGQLLSSFGVSFDLTKLTTFILLGTFLWQWVDFTYHYISNFISDTVWCKLECHSHDDIVYEQLITWLAKQDFARNARNLVVTGTMTKTEGYYDNYGTYVTDEEDKTYDYTPAIGWHRFWFRAHWVFYHRTLRTNEAYSETIELSVIGRSPQILKEIFEEARRDWALKDSTKTILYREGSQDNWQRCFARFPRPVDTVVLEESQKTEFIEDMRDYLCPSTARWYNSRGIPYRRGYLFYGPPGTGKSSLSFAAAGVFGLKIFVLSLASPKLTEDRLMTLFAALPTKCIVLLEDIDSAFVSRTATTAAAPRTVTTVPAANGKPATATLTDDKTPTISFSSLLNAIDGVASQEGRILIMTTNHIEKLDPALIRPGRVDLRIEFKLANRHQLKQLFARMFEVYKDEGENKIVDEKAQLEGHDKLLERLSEEFCETVPADTFSPAEVQGYLLRHKKRPVEAAKGAGVWVRAELRRREEDRKKEEEEEMKKREDGEKKEEEKKEEEPKVNGVKPLTNGVKAEEDEQSS